MGKVELRKGPCAFFLKPGEHTEGVLPVYILSNEDALLMKVVESYVDPIVGEKKQGEMWMMQGPCSFVPPEEVEIMEKRKAIIMDSNEGIYVLNQDTGKVTTKRGQTYMLKVNEQLVEKKVEPEVLQLLSAEQTKDLTHAIVIQVKHNEAIHIVDGRTNKARVVLGPDLVMLDYDEHIQRKELSGKTPKVPKCIRTLAL